MRKYDIYTAKVYYEDDLTKYKVRPVLVLDNQHVIAVIAKITGTSPRENYKGEIVIQDWEEAGLNKPSTIRLSKQYKVDKNKDLRNYVGHLSKNDIKQVERFICTNIEECYDDFDRRWDVKFSKYADVSLDSKEALRILREMIEFE